MGTGSTKQEPGRGTRHQNPPEPLAEEVLAILAGDRTPARDGAHAFAAVKWPIALVHLGKAVTTVTERIGARAFYCHSRQGYDPGTLIQAWIEIPNWDRETTSRQYLACRARVTRVEWDGSRGFGLECSIEDYSLVSS